MMGRLLDPLKDKMRLLLSRALIQLTDDSGDFQLIQLDALADETLDEAERFAEYGFYSRPHPGAEAVIVSIGAVRSHAVVIATHDRQYRLKGLANGDVAMADDQGQVIKLGRDGISVVTSKPITMQAASFAFTGDTRFTGNVHITENLNVDGNSVLGEGAVQQAKLADDTPATTVKAK